MQINCHTHVFNLKSVLTGHAVAIYTARIEDNPRIPKPAKKVLIYLLHKVADGVMDDLLDEIPGEPMERSAKLLMHALRRVAKSDNEIKQPLQEVPRLGAEVDGHQQLRVFAKKSKQWIEARCKVDDLLAYVEIAFAKSIDEVTDRLLAGPKSMPEDAITVALMMDIFDREDYDRGHDPFPQQLADTAAQILRYPGRFLPFVAVNPQRPDHYTQMTNALEHRGYVGVKLYPSLGHSLDVDAMDKVFAYCSEGRVPVTMHCSLGGCTAGENWRLCDPMYWWKFLERHRHLVINFAHFSHFSGVSVTPDEALVPPYRCDFDESGNWDEAQTPYALQIVRLMRAFPGRVYTDVACHTELWEGSKELSKYKARIAWLSGQSVVPGGNTVSDYLLWGSDFWMMRMSCSEKEYWDTFQQALQGIPGLFTKMAGQNARCFLRFGLPDSLIARYVEYVKVNRQRVLEVCPPPPWLASLL